LSAFNWNQTATTTALGVGRDNIGGEDEEYSWEFAFTPRFYFVDTPVHQAYVNARIGWQTELTNSNMTTDRRETQFEDVSLGLGYFVTAYASKSKDSRYSPGLTASLAFPSSKLSRGQGKYLGTSLTFAQIGQVSLLGPKAKGLNSLTVSANVTWSHLFARSYNPTNEDLNVPRQSAAGVSYLSDQVSMRSFAMNRLKLGVSYFIPLFDELVLSNAWAITENYKHDYKDGGTGTGCDVQILNQPCVVAQRDPTRVTRSVNTTFDVGLSYDFFESSLRWGVGYQNDTNQIGDDGKRRSVFYSPGSAFYMDISVLFDGVYRKIDKAIDRKAALNAASGRLSF
jgi:hypothetical protein